MRYHTVQVIPYCTGYTAVQSSYSQYGSYRISLGIAAHRVDGKYNTDCAILSYNLSIEKTFSDRSIQQIDSIVRRGAGGSTPRPHRAQMAPILASKRNCTVAKFSELDRLRPQV